MRHEENKNQAKKIGSIPKTLRRLQVMVRVEKLTCLLVSWKP